MKKCLSWLILLLFFPFFTALAQVSLNPNHPVRYVVQPGDTLWDIAGKFLKKPWEWDKLWHANAQIPNPAKIYPGDVLTLVNNNGNMAIKYERGRYVKLTPQVRSYPVSYGIPTLPYGVIDAFLSENRILTPEQYAASGYIVEQDDSRLTAKMDSKIYVRGLQVATNLKDFCIYRSNGRFIDPDNGKTVGFPALYLSRADLIRTGDPSTMVIKDMTHEVLKDDRVMPNNWLKPNLYFMPHAPRVPVLGKVIFVYDLYKAISPYYIVVINRGSDDGLRLGDVLDIVQPGKIIIDPKERVRRGQQVKLPNERIGQLVVFKVYNGLSVALVVQSDREVYVNYRVTNPV